ncbi:rRNA processing protein [Trachipleistophora hominis]|uniref:KRR-R motif-containing protein 1 n=1 Tax=Trachipleistophora hominis TaxID=72359 RepID=L7JUU7_TRAHO|nr:rRNA processing protein [Trachipleistophora hominis]
MEFNEEEFKDQFLEKSRFEIVYARHLESTLKENQKRIKALLKEKNVRIKINYDERVVQMSTTSKTRDPYVIIKSKDFITLVCKGVPLQEAERIFDDEISYAMLNIQQLASNKEVFINRRNRLIGPNGDTLKALEMLTKTYILMKSKCVCVIGSFANVLKVEQFVLKVMENYHPVHLLKQLVAKKEVEQCTEKKDMNWKNFVPVVKKKTGGSKQTKRKFNVREGKLFMEMPVRKEDIEMIKMNKRKK